MPPRSRPWCDRRREQQTCRVDASEAAFPGLSFFPPPHPGIVRKGEMRVNGQARRSKDRIERKAKSIRHPDAQGSTAEKGRRQNSRKAATKTLQA